MSSSEIPEKVAVITDARFGVVPESPYYKTPVLSLAVKLPGGGGCVLTLADPREIKLLFAEHKAQRDSDLNGKPIWVRGNDWGAQYYSRPWS